ncbi:MAG: hypothetical protein ACI308_07855 [Muribaculaceae bacterium]
MNKLSEQTIKKIQSTLLGVGMTLLVVAAAFPLLGIMRQEIMLMRYVYAAGAALTLVARATQVYHGTNFRIKRLHALERMSALLYCVSAFMLFYYGDRLGGTDWIAFLLAGAIVQLYASFMIDREEKKEAKGNDR